MVLVAVSLAIVGVFFLFFRGQRIFSKGLKLYQEEASRTQKESETLSLGKIR